MPVSRLPWLGQPDLTRWVEPMPKARVGLRYNGAGRRISGPESGCQGKLATQRPAWVALLGTCTPDDPTYPGPIVALSRSGRQELWAGTGAGAD